MILEECLMQYNMNNTFYVFDNRTAPVIGIFLRFSNAYSSDRMPE